MALRDGGDHPLASRSGHCWRRLRWEERAWALELERARGGLEKEEEGVGKKVDLYPLIWADAVMRPHLPNKTRLPPKRHGEWRGWVTHARIDENPVKRGTRSLPRQDVPRKPPRKTC